MRVNLLKWLGGMLFLTALWPLQVRAESSDGFRLDEQGMVTVVSEHAAKEKISSLTFSLSVEAQGAEKVEFRFNQSSAKVVEFRYDKEQKELRVYVSGTEALFGAQQDALSLGQISVLDGNGNAVAADVSVVEGSLKYVYGSEQRTMEEVDMPGTVRLAGTSQPTPTPVPTPTPQPTPGNTQTPPPQPPSPGNTQTPPSQPPAPEVTPTPQATPDPEPDQPTAVKRTPRPSRQPESTDLGTASPAPAPEESQEPESSPAATPSTEDEDDYIFSWSQDEDEKKDGGEPSGKVDLVFVTAIGAILLFAGVLAMAVVILKKKPGASRDQDSLW